MVTRSDSMFVTTEFVQTVTPRRWSDLAAAARIARHTWAGSARFLQSGTPAIAAIDPAKVLGQGVMGEFGDSACQFDPRRAAAHHGKRQPLLPPRRVRFPLGSFECLEDAPVESPLRLRSTLGREPAAPTPHGRSNDGFRRWPGEVCRTRGLSSPSDTRSGSGVDARYLPAVRRRSVGAAAQSGGVTRYPQGTGRRLRLGTATAEKGGNCGGRSKSP